MNLNSPHEPAPNDKNTGAPGSPAGPSYTNYTGPGAPYDPLARPAPQDTAADGAARGGWQGTGKTGGTVKTAPPPKSGAQRRAAGQPAQWVIAVALITVVAMLLWLVYSAASGIANLFAPGSYSTTPPNGTFSVITIAGTIQSTSNDAYSTSASSYHHSDTVAHIKALAENDGNTGILLYMNTGGGGVYESDEVYLALEDYKAQTGRPIWAYMANTCASGGYYICAAADHLAANRNTTTGSIGVYITLTDTSELYGKLGIETVLVRSGGNKGVGVDGVPITGENAAVYQGVVDAAYEQFIALVAEGRDMPLDEVRALADGRVYTGQQAFDLGLVDEIGDWETTLAAFEEETESTPFYPSFNRQSSIARMIGSLVGELPKSDTEAMLEAAENTQSGVPMALYDPALGQSIP